MDAVYEKYELFCNACSGGRDVPTPFCAMVCPQLAEGYGYRDLINHSLETNDYVQLMIPIIFTVIIIRIVKVFVVMPLMTKSGPFLNRKRQFVKLVQKEHLTENVVRFRYKLPGSQTLGLYVGGFIKVHHPNSFKRQKEGEWNGRADPEAELDEIDRKYTPVTSEDDKGYFDIVVKSYRPSENPKFPDGGKSGYKMECQSIGDLLQISGPFGHIKYLGGGVFKKTGKEYKTANIAMIAGGSGITPMLQIIRDVIKNSSDHANISLLYANQTEDDIILRKELEALAPRLKCYMTLDRPPKGWEGGAGFITKGAFFFVFCLVCSILISRCVKVFWRILLALRRMSVLQRS